MKPDILNEISRLSSKLLFLFNLRTLQFEHLSQVTEQLLGLPHAAVLQDPALLLQAVHPDEVEAVLNRFAEVKSGQSADMTIRCQTDAGSIRYVSVSAQPLPDAATGETVLIAGLAEDITRDAEYEVYLLEYIRRKDSTLAIVAHDLRAPLGHIKGACSLLQSDHENQCYTETANYLSIINVAYRECLELIETLLTEERMKSAVVEVKRDRVDVVALICRILSTFQQADRLGLHFECNSGEEKVIAELDEMKMIQIINNLVSNSVKFTQPGGRVSITVERQADQVRITHADTGIGIPRALQPYVFDFHSIAAREGLQGQQSHGLGLSIVKQLVVLQGGEIWLDSEAAQGTVFHLTFPLFAKHGGAG